MIFYIIELLGSLFTNLYLNYFFFPVFALAFIASIPSVIRWFFNGGR